MLVNVAMAALVVQDVNKRQLIMIIPWQEIPAETLQNMVESYILREGTDYGEMDYSLVEKTAQLLHNIKIGKAIIVWSELHETFDIKPKNTFNQ